LELALDDGVKLLQDRQQKEWSCHSIYVCQQFSRLFWNYLHCVEYLTKGVRPFQMNHSMFGLWILY